MVIDILSQVGTLSCSGDVKIFRPRRMKYIFNLPPFLNEVFSEKR